VTVGGPPGDADLSTTASAVTDSLDDTDVNPPPPGETTHSLAEKLLADTIANMKLIPN
jgi:hypothetical protein